MAAATEEPALPAGLGLVRMAEADSARAEAVRRARAGADEGTLVWVEAPAAPRARFGRAWLTEPDPGLHGALVLRPGLPAEECAELAPVAAVALGRAVSETVEAMTELHYRWPNDLLIDRGKAAGIWLDGGDDAARLDWLVVSWALNTRASPPGLGHDAAALAADGASGPLDHGALLATIARQLVAAITTWDEAGLDALVGAWRGRIRLGEAINVTTADGRPVTGTATAVDDDGALRLATDAGRETRIALARFFGLGEAPS